MKKEKIILILILLLAAALRLTNLSTNPPGLTWDEASLGYNAYSILKTGRDEYGSFLPLQLKSFGDYKPAFYVYLTIPFVATLGLNELAVRLPSALLGIATVYLVFLLVVKLMENDQSGVKKQFLALSVAFMLAISPLAIQFSRPAFETNVAVFLNTLAVLFFIKGLKKPQFFVYATLSMFLSLFTYQASRLFAALLILLMVIIYRKEIIFDKFIKLSLVLVVLSFAVLSFVTIGSGQTNRLAVMNLFAYRRSEAEINRLVLEDPCSKTSVCFNFMHGEWFAYTRGIFERYLIYLSPKTLFVSGDPSPRHRVPDLGVLYYFSVILLPLGLIFWLRLKQKSSVLIIAWLILAPLPAVLSRDLITMIRALNLVIPLAILEGTGLYVLIQKIRQTKGILIYFMLTGWLLVMMENVFLFLDSYFVHAPKEFAISWLSSYKESISLLNNFQVTYQYQKIIMTDTYGQPYIYDLFFSQYLPQKFQVQAVLSQPTIDVGTVRNIDNIEFRHIYWPDDRNLKNSLFIGTLEELPDKDILPFTQYKIWQDIKSPDGQIIFRIVAT